MEHRHHPRPPAQLVAPRRLRVEALRHPPPPLQLLRALLQHVVRPVSLELHAVPLGLKRAGPAPSVGGVGPPRKVREVRREGNFRRLALHCRHPHEPSVRRGRVGGGDVGAGGVEDQALVRGEGDGGVHGISLHPLVMLGPGEARREALVQAAPQPFKP